MSDESQLRMFMLLLHESKKAIDERRNEPGDEEDFHKASGILSEAWKLHDPLSDFP